MRHRNALLIASVLGVALAGAARAADLPIKGSYGNKDGCAYAKSGQSTGSDDFFLLTKGAVTTASTACTFTKITARPKNSFTVTVQCEEEGNADALAPFQIDIVPQGSSSYLLKLDDGQTWGPLALCR